MLQLCGKIKARMKMPADADDAAMQALALANPDLQAAIAGRPVRKVICVRGRLVNVVA